MPEVIDLFSGAGGLSLGFRAAGCVIRAAVDADRAAGESFLCNFTTLQPECPPLVLAGPEYDLERMHLEQVAWTCRPDFVIGGPPCQAFSRLGRGKLDSLSDEGFVGDPRNRLYRKFLEAVALWQPQAVVMENVPGMLSVAGVNYAAVVTGELAELGYRAGYALLNAVWYGVPQFRERLFFIGIRGDLGKIPVAPPTTHEAVLPEGYRRPLRLRAPALPFSGVWELIEGELAVPAASPARAAVTVSQALDDLPPLTDHLSGGTLPRGDYRRPLAYRGDPHGEYAQMMRRWPGFPAPACVTDHVTRRTPRDYDTFRRMKPGDRYPDAVKFARQRFAEELERLSARGEAPLSGSEAWHQLEKRFVPPYGEQEFVDKWRKMIADEPSWTVPAHLARDSYSHIHPDSRQARMISVREAARLQSFPDAFTFCGNMGECFRQIGNAVPPLLSWSLARALLSLLGAGDEERFPSVDTN
jgi:DNA (cytosine-5)-methyltransferase 1